MREFDFIDGAEDRSKRLVLMYPNNELNDQVRDYNDTFNGVTVLLQRFFPKEGARD